MAAKPKPKPKPKGPPDAARINARAAKDPAFRKRALKNPGLRSKLDPKYLAAPQRAARVLNTRLNSPITPGSQITGRDLAHEAQAATTVRYGPQERELGQQLGVSQAVERDTGTFYDQYRQALQQHAANVQAFQAGAQQALAQTAQGITGLAGQEGAALQQQANQGAAQQGVAPAGDLSQLASNAAAVRQSLVGSFQGQQALQGAAANQYASSQANVVAPGQKLGAQAQARGRTQDVRKQLLGLKAEEGAFNQQFRGERTADEFKNQLAVRTLTGNQANMAADNATAAANAREAARAARERERANRGRAAETERANRAREANQRAGRRSRDQAAAGKVNTHGYTDAAWAALSVAERRKIIAADKSSSRGSGGGKGPEWKTSEAMSRGMSQVTSLKEYADKAKRGQPFVAGHARQTPADRRAAAQKIMASVAAPDDPILVTAALDAVYDGHISPATVKKLIAAGYKPSRVAAALGVPTGRAGRDRARVQRAPRTEHL